MNYRLRVFVKTSSGEIRRLPLAKYERLLGHDPATFMPEFVGKEMPTAVVMLTESGRVVDATLAETLKLKMNNKGQVSKRWHERLQRLSSEAVGAYKLFCDDERPGHDRDRRNGSSFLQRVLINLF